MVDKVDPKLVIDYPVATSIDKIEERAAIIYALGIAFSQDPLQKDDRVYTYEQDDNFKVFPTFSCVLPKNGFFDAILECGGFPPHSAMMILHAEQRIEMYKPLKVQSSYKTVGRLSNVQDKKKGALVTENTDTYEIDDQGNEILSFKKSVSVYIRGIGGFGFKGLKISEKIPDIPNIPPTRTVEQATYANQCLVYRLSGDFNPLHVDPDMAAMGGFKQPILHGLATYGMCAKVIIQIFCKGNGDKLKAYQARFTSHVFPGETLLVQMWKDGSRIIFSAKTKERGLEVIRGFMDINEDPKL